ncbi:MAG TPA: D-alanyl-lipoteichoic acid biosynthesis protein DltD, partial [Bacteroidia bacterium]|nr:D-alanyl-lipoteichoic acid biosynthesis protein DltD [Bacteroidia bacterium]
MTRERLLKIHFPALLLTGIIILFLPFSGFWQDITGQSCPGPVQHSPDQNRRFFATISESYQAEKDFFAQVESGSLVVMGSSEMSNTGLPGIPFNFFTERGIPAIGFGHAGNQSLCMLTQLALMRSSLLQMRLVIIISPGWFEGKSAAGTPLQSFLEFNDEHFLYYLASDPLLPANVKTHLKSYVHAHLEKIDSPGALLKSMAYQHESDKSFLHAALFAPFVSLNETYAARKKRVMQDLFVAGCISKSYVRLTATTPQREPFPSLSVNWDS